MAGVSLPFGLDETGGAAGATEWNAGTVAAIGPGLQIGAGNTLQVTQAQRRRTLPFPIVGVPASAAVFCLALAQAGTLIANGAGTLQTAQVNTGVFTNPTATERLVLSTVHSGTVTTQGTVAVNSGGTVALPAWGNVALAPGDSVQIVNQPTADATFANFTLALLFEVTP